MEDGHPTLEVGFAIDPGASFDQLTKLDALIDSATANAIQDFAAVERASKGMLDLGSATAAIKTFGGAATREAQATARELRNVESAGESLIRQLERQNATFGKSRDEVRAMKVEAQILAAEQKGLTEQAGRLRAVYDVLLTKQNEAAASAAREAQAVREAAFAHGQFEAAARRGMAAYREQQQVQAAAATEQDRLAAGAQRLRASIDPAAAAQQRFDREMAEARVLISAGVISLDEYVAKLRQQQLALEQSGVSAVRSAGQQRMGMQQLGFQLNDVATMYAGGAHAGQIFATQTGQVVQALQLMGGEGNTVLRFLGSWQGAIVTAIAIALVPFIAKLVEGNNELDKAAEKLRKDAEGTDIARRAKERFAVSAGGVAAAIRDQTAATKDAINATHSSAEQDNIAAKQNLELEVSHRRVTKALLDRAIAEQDITASAGGQMIAGEAGGVANSIMARNVATLRARLAEQTGLITDAEQRVQQTRVSLAFEAAEQLATASGRVTRAYDQQLSTLERTVRTQIEAGKVVDASLTQQIIGLKQRRQAAIEAAQAQERLSSAAAGRETGRSLSSSQAAAIANSAGFQVNSADRTFASQKALYDRWVAAGRPASNPVAKPGSSAHEFGNALDIQKMVGVTVQRIRAAFAAEGVRLTKVFSEQGHWHVEWARSAEDIRAVADARHDAADAAREQLKFERDIAALAQSQVGLVGPTAVAEQRARAAADQRRVWQDLFGEEDPLGDSLRAGERARSTEWEAKWAADLERQEELQSQLRTTADLADSLGNSLSAAFGRGGAAMDQALRILGNYGTAQDDIDKRLLSGTLKQTEATKLSRDLQLSSLIGITDAAKGLFKEHSAGYRAMEAAEKALTIVQVARTAIDVAGGAARMFATLGPFAFPAVAAMIGVMASLGFGGGGSAGAPSSNTGTGTVLGDRAAQSESIKNALTALKDVDTVTSIYARQMAESLRSIDNQIGGAAAVIARGGDISASAGVQTGFKSNAGLMMGILGGPLGYALTKVPIIGGILKSLFGTTTSVTGNGLFAGPQSVGSILGGGFDASYYSDVQKKKKFLGITYSNTTSTQYGAADPGLENQFTLILREFDRAILAAAGPLGEATDAIEARLNGFVLNIGRVDLKGLTGEEIEEKLTAIFGAAADQMAAGAFPEILRFQKAGEGAFETLVRVASTVEAVTIAMDRLGGSALTMDAKLGLAERFDSLGDFTSATDAYFQAFYTREEQAAAQAAQLARVFESLGLTMPSTLSGFRSLVEAQNLTTAAGQTTYATLLQLAPAFADLQMAMAGAKSAADILSERQDLQRQLLELAGDTAAIRALDLAKIDPSNRALQQQVWAVKDAQDAANAAKQLRDAWASVGDTILDEVKRIRGLTDVNTPGGFATLQGQFNAATLAARGGDQDAAKRLPGLSQSLLSAAAMVATSRQELDRVQAQTAASLEQTKAAIDLMSGASSIVTTTTAATIAAAAAAQGATPAAANDDLLGELRALRTEVAQLRSENNAGHAATASNTGRVARKLDDATAATGGDSIAVSIAA